MKNMMTLLLAGLTLTSVSAIAMDDKAMAMDDNMMNMNMMDQKMMDIKMMDKDGDGMISKPEFMAAHEMMFESMKNNQGMIDVKDMQKMKKNMMKGKSGMTEPMNPNDRDAMGRVKP